MEIKDRYFTPLSWDSLTQPKQYGGLRFRRTSDFNNAML